MEENMSSNISSLTYWKEKNNNNNKGLLLVLCLKIKELSFWDPVLLLSDCHFMIKSKGKIDKLVKKLYFLFLFFLYIIKILL